MKSRLGMLIRCCTLFLALSLCYGAPVHDTLVSPADWTGSRTEGSGLVTGGTWVGDLLVQSLSWNITHDPGTGIFTYTYTFTNFSTTGTISLGIIELSTDCIPDNPDCVLNAPSNWKFGNFVRDGPHPGIPEGATLPGVESPNIPVVWEFQSMRNPVWGGFYVDQGQKFAYNLGLDPVACTGSCLEDVLNYIPRPNGPGDPIPEPSSVTLLALGLGALAWGARRRARARS